jgi:membrane-associated phospholipid phosphatase
MNVRYINFTFLIILTSAFLPSTAYAQTVDADTTYSIEDTLHTAIIDTFPAKQHLYRVNNWVSGSFCVIATAADIYAIPNVIKNKKDITDQELQGLNKNIFTGFDHWALEQDPAQRQSYAKASDYTLPGLIILPGLLALDKNIRQDWFRILVMYYEMHAITFSIYNYSPFGPAFQNKYRPLVYYDQLPINERTPGNNRNSMYSGHTATAIASTYFMVKVYCDYHPEICNKKYILYGIATIPPLVEGYFRVKAMLHFPSDVLIGVAIGAACGILVPEIHRFKNHKVNLGLSSTPVGPGLGLTWNID